MVPRIARHIPLSLVVTLGCLIAAPVGAQVPSADPSERLRAVLPAAAAERVLATIAEARAQALPAQALEHRALELTAKGLPAASVEQGVARHAERLGLARAALVSGGRDLPTDDETEAAELVMHHGAGGGAVSALAKSAPSGQSLTVPLFVLASLMDRGLPSDQALARVHAALQVRGAAPAGAAHGGPDSPGKPATVPSNNGRGNRPAAPGRS